MPDQCVSGMSFFFF